MTRWLQYGLLVMIAIGTSFLVQTQEESDLPNLYVAPELHEGNWLNSEIPLQLSNLRGQVVLLEMWTFDCINCIRTIPYVQEWHETYAEDGLVVIGNHYPEFNYEHDLGNLRAAIDRLGITYPVVQDNDRETWAVYRNRYWPTVYLIGKQGNVRYTHIGEGRYERTEAAIQALLAEPYLENEEDVSIPIWSLTPTDALNVRAGAGTQFERIGLIQPGEAYYVREALDGWYRIRFDNHEQAFVSADYVTITSELTEEAVE